MKFNVEYTDTYGGESNYSWVKRALIEAPDDANQALIMRRAKKALGLSGLKGEVVNYGETIRFKPYGYCTVLFVTPEY